MATLRVCRGRIYAHLAAKRMNSGKKKPVDFATGRIKKRFKGTDRLSQALSDGFHDVLPFAAIKLEQGFGCCIG